jgi:hypothetical protein
MPSAGSELDKNKLGCDDGLQKVGEASSHRQKAINMRLFKYNTIRLNDCKEKSELQVALLLNFSLY